jgi:ATP-dependent Clp protease ATP-binding subunit ClpB
VILLDEIEKAHPDTFNILLQVLDEGRLTDNKGRLANFRNAIIFMTSNMGSQIIQENFENLDMENREFAMETTKMEVLALLKKTIRPEFINRIDEIIMFTPLNKEEVTEIVKLQLNQLSKMLQEKSINLSATEEAIESLSKKGFNPQFGARPIKRVIQKEVLNKLSKEILSGSISPKSNILLDAFNDELVFRNK